MSVSFPKKSNLIAWAVLGLALTGCAGGFSGLNLPGGDSDSSNQPAIQSSASDVAKTGPIIDDTTKLILSNPKQLNSYCPPVKILGDTNVYQTFAKGGEGNASMLIHQASITQTARECTTLGAEMFIKVGVAGRVLGGPKSSDTSKANLPLRIVVKQNNDLLYTHLYKIPVTLTPPDRSALFAKVEEAIAIPTPQERNVQILVGFDGGSR